MNDYSGVSFWPTGQTGNQGRVMWCVVGGDLLLLTKRCGLIKIPDGFVFDGPSIPWWAVPWMPQGKMFIPSVLHDWLITQPSYKKKDCDLTFYDALIERKVPKFLARLSYAAVRSKN